VSAPADRSLRRELLRWRDLIAEQYLASDADPVAHGAAFRALLQIHPEARSASGRDSG